MNIEFTTTLRRQECTVFADMVPPDPHTGIFDWHVETLTIIDAADIGLMLTEQEELQISEKCSEVAGEQDIRLSAKFRCPGRVVERLRRDGLFSDFVDQVSMRNSHADTI